MTTKEHSSQTIIDIQRVVQIDESSHQRSSIKTVLLKISQKSQENTCVGVYFSMKLQSEACNLIYKGTLAQVFYCKFCKNFENISIKT